MGQNDLWGGDDLNTLSGRVNATVEITHRIGFGKAVMALDAAQRGHTDRFMGFGLETTIANETAGRVVRDQVFGFGDINDIFGKPK
jgi:hypothetical protein